MTEINAVGGGIPAEAVNANGVQAVLPEEKPVQAAVSALKGAVKKAAGLDAGVEGKAVAQEFGAVLAKAQEKAQDQKTVAVASKETASKDAQAVASKDAQAAMQSKDGIKAKADAKAIKPAKLTEADADLKAAKLSGDKAAMKKAQADAIKELKAQPGTQHAVVKKSELDAVKAAKADALAAQTQAQINAQAAALVSAMQAQGLVLSGAPYGATGPVPVGAQGSAAIAGRGAMPQGALGSLGPALPAVLQPIIVEVPVPMAVPVPAMMPMNGQGVIVDGPMLMPFGLEVLEADEGLAAPVLAGSRAPMTDAPISLGAPGGATLGSPNGATLSQDYVAEREGLSAVLAHPSRGVQAAHAGVAGRLAPRAGSPMYGGPVMAREGLARAFKDSGGRIDVSSRGLSDEGSRLALVMPNLGGASPAGRGVAGASMAAASDGVRAMSSGLDIANPDAVAAQALRLASRGGGSVKVRVAPEHLGEVTISVRNDRGRLNVRMESASGEAREVLASALPELRQSLSNARYNVANVEVGVAPRADGEARSGLGSSLADSGRQSQGWGGGANSDSQSSAWDRYFARSDEFLDRHGSGNRQRGNYRQAYDQYAQA